MTTQTQAVWVGMIAAAVAMLWTYLLRRCPALEHKASEYDLMNATIERPGHTLKVLSYNVFIRPPGVNSYGNDYKDERLALLTKEVGDYDIVCLQELFGLASGRRGRFLEAARGHGLKYTATIPSHWAWVPPKVVDGGLVILSRYPIVASDYTVFSRSSLATIDCVVSKGALWAKVALGNASYVHVFTTHLQADNGRLGRHGAIRMHQLKEMAVLIQRVAGNDGQPVILTGDLNINGMAGVSEDDMAEYRQAMDTLSSNSTAPFQDVLLAHGGAHAVTSDGCPINRKVPRTSCPTFGLERLDYVLMRNGPATPLRCVSSSVREYAVDDTFPFVQLSDHMAVEAVFALSTYDRPTE